MQEEGKIQKGKKRGDEPMFQNDVELCLETQIQRKNPTCQSNHSGDPSRKEGDDKPRFFAVEGRHLQGDRPIALESPRERETPEERAILIGSKAPQSMDLARR